MLALGKRLLLLFCHMGLSIMVACFIKVIKEESISKMEIITLCNLIKVGKQVAKPAHNQGRELHKDMNTSRWASR